MISSSFDTAYKLLQNRTVIHKAGSQVTQFICIYGNCKIFDTLCMSHHEWHENHHAAFYSHGFKIR